MFNKKVFNFVRIVYVQQVIFEKNPFNNEGM